MPYNAKLEWVRNNSCPNKGEVMYNTACAEVEEDLNHIPQPSLGYQCVDWYSRTTGQTHFQAIKDTRIALKATILLLGLFFAYESLDSCSGTGWENTGCGGDN